MSIFHNQFETEEEAHILDNIKSYHLYKQLIIKHSLEETEQEKISLKILTSENYIGDWYFQKHSDGKITVETEPRLIKK
jgi:hypothetical protein